MNWKQKILTGLALLVFLISAANAPWEVTQRRPYSYDPDIPAILVRYGPIWAPPQYSEYELCRLEWVPLLATWFAIGALYGGLFLLAKSRSSKTKLTTTKDGDIPVKN